MVLDGFAALADLSRFYPNYFFLIIFDWVI